MKAEFDMNIQEEDDPSKDYGPFSGAGLNANIAVLDLSGSEVRLEVIGGILVAVL